MSDIRPYNNDVTYIPQDNPSEAIYPVEYYVVTEQDINSSYDTPDKIQPVSEESVSIQTSGGVGSGAGGGGTSPSIDDLIPRIQVASLEPLTRTVNEGEQATLTIVANVKNDVTSVISYQWQKSESDSEEWYNLVGENSASFTTGILSYANDNGDKYRCILYADTASNSPFTTDVITLNIRRVITITSQPIIPGTLYAGETLTLNVGANITSGTIFYQWQYKDFETETFININGANSSSYTTGILTIADDIFDVYRCVLTNPAADTKITDTVTIVLAGADLKVTPAVNGIRFWSFKEQGPLILDPSTSDNFEIQCLSDSKNIKTTMWGQGSCNARGGDANGLIPLTLGSVYKVMLNAGRGLGGTTTVSGRTPNNGGGYAGFFNGQIVNQANALLIAGGAGGGGATPSGTCVYSGGFGGGLIGGDAYSIPGTGGTSVTYQASRTTINPACTEGPDYGWYTRSGASLSNPIQGDIRQLVIKWNGDVIYDGPSSGITNGFFISNGYRYYPSTYRGSDYGWCTDGISCETCVSPNADYGNSFDIYRTAEDSFDGGKGASQTSAGSGGAGVPATVTQTFNTPGTHTLSIPSGATNITYEIVGGTGAIGATGSRGQVGAQGQQESYPGGTGARGQKVYGTINSNLIAGKTLTFNVASNGSPGGFTSGGNGGLGASSGGRGGNNNSETINDFYGSAGGGGGGSTSIRATIDGASVYLAVAGGGGGGGGGQLFSREFINGNTSLVLNTTGNISNGQNGGNSLASFNGAGGGGGGGWPGGLGGEGSTAGNSISGTGGFGGEGYYNPSFINDANVEQSSTNAYVKITYDLGITLGSPGSALQGGNGGNNVYGGGGGGGGYWGGGGGVGYSNVSTGGGGGCGYVSNGVISGVTTIFSGVTDINRGVAGDINSNSRVVLNLETITITSQPTLRASYFSGETATMTVLATITSGVILYQWQKLDA